MYNNQPDPFDLAQTDDSVFCATANFSAADGDPNLKLTIPQLIFAISITKTNLISANVERAQALGTIAAYRQQFEYECVFGDVASTLKNEATRKAWVDNQMLIPAVSNAQNALDVANENIALLDVELSELRSLHRYRSQQLELRVAKIMLDAQRFESMAESV